MSKSPNLLVKLLWWKRVVLLRSVLARYPLDCKVVPLRRCRLDLIFKFRPPRISLPAKYEPGSLEFSPRPKVAPNFPEFSSFVLVMMLFLLLPEQLIILGVMVLLMELLTQQHLVAQTLTLLLVLMLIHVKIQQPLMC